MTECVSSVLLAVAPHSVEWNCIRARSCKAVKFANVNFTHSHQRAVQLNL